MINLEKNESKKENNLRSKKKYTKPEIKSEKIMEAGLGATCNGTSNGGRKSATPGCNAGSLKT